MISILFPTRNRPENLRRLVNSIQGTVKSLFPEIFVYIDEDDSISVNEAENLGIRYIIGKRKALSLCYNDLAKEASGEILMFGGDDIVFKLEGWDKIVIEKFSLFEDKVLFVTSWDGHEPGKLGTHGFLHRRWIDTVGYFLPPYFRSLCVDNWINDVAQALNRKLYLPEIIAEHIHYTTGTAKFDMTYADARLNYERDAFVYTQTLEERIADVKKLKDVLHIEHGCRKIIVNNTELAIVECVNEFNNVIIRNAIL